MYYILGIQFILCTYWKS